MYARYRYDALHGAPTPTPAVPTVAPLGPGRAVEPDLMQSRAARCWPVLAAWAVVPLDELQIMLVDAVTVRPAADAAMRARVDSDVRSPRSASRPHSVPAPPCNATPRLATRPLASPSRNPWPLLRGRWMSRWTTAW